MRFLVRALRDPYEDLCWAHPIEQERIPLAGFSACGGSLQRHHSIPPQCVPARRAFYYIGEFEELGRTLYNKKAAAPADDTIHLPEQQPHIYGRNLPIYL